MKNFKDSILFFFLIMYIKFYFILKILEFLFSIVLLILKANSYFLKKF